MFRVPFFGCPESGGGHGAPAPPFPSRTRRYQDTKHANLHSTPAPLFRSSPNFRSASCSISLNLPAAFRATFSALIRLTSRAWRATRTLFLPIPADTRIRSTQTHTADLQKSRYPAAPALGTPKKGNSEHAESPFGIQPEIISCKSVYSLFFSSSPPAGLRRVSACEENRKGETAMNQIEIGKFIAVCRREKKLTQAQLAERLNITDRAVSKWETGKSLPGKEGGGSALAL